MALGDSISTEEKNELATLIYYPEKRLEKIKDSEEELDSFYAVTLGRLIDVCKLVTAKYTRSKVRKAMPREYQCAVSSI